MAARHSPGGAPGRTKPRRAIALAATIAAGSCPCAAHAQVTEWGQLLESPIPMVTTTGRNQSVTERVRPELRPTGLPLGGFRLYPSVLAGAGFSSNVTGAEVDTRADGYAELRPEMLVQSQWARHALNGTFYYDGRRYFRTPQENQDAFLAQVDGRLDILDQDSLFASGSYRRTYEDQEEASFPVGGAGAVAVDQPRALLRGVYVANRLRWTVSTDYNGFRYLDTRSTTGARLDLSYRNRDVYRVAVRTEYLLGKDNSVFAEGSYRRTDYRTTIALDDRTSNEYRVGVGAIADVAALFRVAGAVGYYRRTYQSPLFRSVGGIAADVRGDYYLTPLTTISAIVSRQLEEASVTGSSGYINTRVGGRIDHELLRNLLPFLFVDYVQSRFKGIDRHDHVIDGGAGVNYLVNRMLTAKLNTEYVSRISQGVSRGPNIDEFRGQITLELHP